MRNIVAMVTGYVIATAMVLSYVFIGLASIVGIILMLQLLGKMYVDARKWLSTSKLGPKAVARTDEPRRSDVAKEQYS